VHVGNRRTVELCTSLVDVFVRFIRIVDKDHQGVGLSVDRIVENRRAGEID